MIIMFEIVLFNNFYKINVCLMSTDQQKHNQIQIIISVIVNFWK